MREEYKWIEATEMIVKKMIEGYEHNKDGYSKDITEIVQRSKKKISNSTEKKEGKEINDLDAFSILNIILTRYDKIENKQNMINQIGKNIGITEIVEFKTAQKGIVKPFYTQTRLTNGQKNEKKLKILLWELFCSAFKYANDSSTSNKNEFCKKYNNVVIENEKINQNVSKHFYKRITVGLFFVKPEFFLPLDIYTKELLKNLNLIEENIEDSLRNANNYLDLIDKVKLYIKNNTTEYKSIFEMSNYAYETYKDKITYYAGGYNSKEETKRYFIDKNIFALGWENYGNLKEYIKNNGKFKKEDKALEYFTRLEKGDVIYLTNGAGPGKTRIFAVGTIGEDFKTGYELKEGIGHTIPVDWEELTEPVVVNTLINRALIELTGKNAKMIYEFEDINKEYIEKENRGEIEVSKDNKIGRNVLIYGVPGSGKSYYVKNEILKDVSEEQYERVVFYPEYMYYDFVGQKVPADNGQGLQPEAGPFTRILKKAINDSYNHYYLIIEEMNRGNAEAVFGDILQLLDRENGESVYKIDNKFIKECINEKNEEDEETKLVDKIYLPSNLSIYATVNNSDQNVFNLDTAFGRRWEYEIKSCNPKREELSAEASMYFTNVINGTKYKWNELRKQINKVILQTERVYNKEDKQIGLFYIESDCLKENAENTDTYYRKKFANKIFRYLWLDVFKNCREEMFYINNRSTLEEFVNKFEESGKLENILKIELEENDEE